MNADTKPKTIDIGMESFDLGSSVPNIAEFFAVYDTGLQPTSGSGVILHRVGLGSEQIVYQYAPHFRAVGYKEDEGAEDMETYNLPFPYWIVCISYEAGIFQGVRHFYSPTPIWSLDQRLYAANLPNTNTRGYPDFDLGKVDPYNPTSIGWVCLYHQKHDEFKDLNSKLNYALARHDPLGEPYNYGNMSGTDGFTLYSMQRRDQPFLSDPYQWQIKGQEEGLDWVTQEDLWIPMMVDLDAYKMAETAIYPEIAGEYSHNGNIYNRKPYTLSKALYGDHYVYYSKRGAEKLNAYTNALKDGNKEEVGKIIDTLLRTSIVTGSQKVEADVNMPKPAPSLKIVMSSLSSASILKKLNLKNPDFCATCGRDIATADPSGKSYDALALMSASMIDYCGVDNPSELATRISRAVEKVDGLYNLPTAFISELGNKDVSYILGGTKIVPICMGCAANSTGHSIMSRNISYTPIEQTNFEGYEITIVSTSSSSVNKKMTNRVVSGTGLYIGYHLSDDHPYRKMPRDSTIHRLFTGVSNAYFSATHKWDPATAPSVMFSLVPKPHHHGLLPEFAEALDADVCFCGTLWDRSTMTKRDWAVYAVPYLNNNGRQEFMDSIPHGISTDLPTREDEYFTGCISCCNKSRFNPLTGCLEDTRSKNFSSEVPRIKDDPLKDYKFTPNTYKVFMKLYALKYNAKDILAAQAADMKKIKKPTKKIPYDI